MRFHVLLTIVLVYAVDAVCGFSSFKLETKYADMVDSDGQQRRVTLMQPSDFTVYYSMSSNQTFKNMLPRPRITPGQALRLPFIGDPCDCFGLQCGCCAGLRIPQFRLDSQACANLTYDPANFAVILDVTINQQVILHYLFSAQNPPPFCIPLILYGAPTGIDFCLQLYDIYTSGTNLHVCIDLETKFASAPILVLHFDCVVLGSDGISFVKPDSESALPPADVGGTTETTAYDEVTEIKRGNETDHGNNIQDATTSYESTTSVEDGMNLEGIIVTNPDVTASSEDEFPTNDDLTTIKNKDVTTAYHHTFNNMYSTIHDAENLVINLNKEISTNANIEHENAQTDMFLDNNLISNDNQLFGSDLEVTTVLVHPNIPSSDDMDKTTTEYSLDMENIEMMETFESKKILFV